jgi:hypothetical protein
MSTATARSGTSEALPPTESSDETCVPSVHRLRTASVILPSGQRLRRKVSLLSSDEDEDPFDDSDVDGSEIGLLQGTELPRRGASSASLNPFTWCINSCPWPSLHKVRGVLKSEAFKRYVILSQMWTEILGLPNVLSRIGSAVWLPFGRHLLSFLAKATACT